MLRIRAQLGLLLTGGLFAAPGCLPDDPKGDTAPIDSDVDAGDDSGGDTGTTSGVPVEFSEVAGGFDPMDEDELIWDCGSLGEACCADLNTFLIADQTVLEAIFLSELPDSPVPEVVFGEGSVVVSFTTFCGQQPTQLATTLAFSGDGRLLLRETLYMQETAYDAYSRPYNVIVVDGGPYSAVTGEVTVEVVDWLRSYR